MTYSLTQKIGPWLDKAFADHGRGEPLLWEMCLLPGPQGEPKAVCFVWMKGPTLDTTIHASFEIVSPLTAEEETLTEVVSGVLHALREARSQQLAQATQEATNSVDSHSNGHQPHPSGLILP